MKPYFQDESVTIYHGDCRELLPSLSAEMTIITDQPYGTGWVRGGGRAGEFKAAHEQPAWDVWDLSWIGLLNAPKRTAVFCPRIRLADACDVLAGSVVCTYTKTNVRPNGNEKEYILISPAQFITLPDCRVYNGDSPLHPCQKPLEVMHWIVGEVATESDVILDPYMGSGTTLRAAKDMGIKAIGIEIDERYCEIAAKRMAQQVLPIYEKVAG